MGRSDPYFGSGIVGFVRHGIQYIDDVRGVVGEGACVGHVWVMRSARYAGTGVAVSSGANTRGGVAGTFDLSGE